MDHRIEVTVEAASGKDLVCIPCAVKFEQVDSILADHLQTNVAKIVVIFRPRKSIASIDDLKVCTPAKLNTLLLGLRITSPRGHPDTGRELISICGFANGRKAIGETPVEFPKRSVVVPSIVEENGIKCYTPLIVQLMTKGIDSANCASLIVRIEIAEVIPGVVVQEGSIRVRSLAFDISKKCSTHLSWGSNADYGRIRN